VLTYLREGEKVREGSTNDSTSKGLWGQGALVIQLAALLKIVSHAQIPNLDIPIAAEDSAFLSGSKESLIRQAAEITYVGLLRIVQW